MKLIKKYALQQIFITLFIYFLTPSLAAQEIRMINVPDPNFRVMLGIDGIHFDTENNITNPEKAAQMKRMELPELNISNLSGIEAFTSLQYLWCGNNKLVVLDLSSNTSLIELYVSGNQLTDLDISKNTSLIELNVMGNQLTDLDISKNTSLIELNVMGNQLTDLDISKNTSLTALFCDNNQLATLDVSKNRNLVFLTCANNKLRQLDLSQNHKLLDLQYGNLDKRQVKISWRVKFQYLLNDILILDTSNDTKLVYRLIFDALLLLSILFIMFRNPDVKKQSIALFIFMTLFWVIDIRIKSTMGHGPFSFDLYLPAFWILSFVMLIIFIIFTRKTKKTKWDWTLVFLCTPIVPFAFLVVSNGVPVFPLQKDGIIQNFVGELVGIVIILGLVKRHNKKHIKMSSS
jgi:hypothetical protein